MSSKTIHYINVNHKQFDDSLVRQSDLDDDRFVYGKCPVYKHKSSRTFVGISPIDFKLQVMKSPDGITTIRSTNQAILEGDEDHINSPRPVIQLKFPRFVFWTQEDDIWFDFTDHPMTSLVNNFIAVGGWFNLSNWSRGSSLGLTIVNPSKPVIIKKGDPLFRMSFHSSNPDDVINLSQEKDPDKIDYIWNEYDRWRKEDLKIFDTRSTKDLWKSKLFSKTNTTSKCPFSFLFK